MKKAIYKIENKINHKLYIGQSIDPEQRFAAHCEPNKAKSSLISKAIQKYGKENFEMTILGWFEDYNEKERYYIQYYRSLTPNGYNIATGGEDPPIMKGENHPLATIDEETANCIKKELKDWSIQRRQITKKYHVTEDIMRHINNGTSWHDENETYPLRPPEAELNKKRVEKIIELLLTTNLPQNQIGAMVGWGRSAAKEINAGRNHHDDRLVYPLRNHIQENRAILNL